jgi:hypothetical protein
MFPTRRHIARTQRPISDHPGRLTAAARMSARPFRRLVETPIWAILQTGTINRTGYGDRNASNFDDSAK